MSNLGGSTRTPSYHASAAKALNDAVCKTHVSVLRNAFEVSGDQLKLDRRAAEIKY